MQNTKELMHRHCGTNNRAPRWTFTDPCKPEVRPGAREESASPAWLAAPDMNACNTTKVYIWRLDTGCGPTLYRKCHNHNTPRQFLQKRRPHLELPHIPTFCNISRQIPFSFQFSSSKIIILLFCLNSRWVGCLILVSWDREHLQCYILK